MTPRAKTRIRELARHYHVNVKFLNLKKIGGYYDHSNNLIVIKADFNNNESLSTFFHELGHSHCHKNNIWSKYHSDTSRFTAAYAYKVEKWVDIWGEKEFIKHYPRGYYGKFCRAYRNKRRALRFLDQYWSKKGVIRWNISQKI